MDEKERTAFVYGTALVRLLQLRAKQPTKEQLDAAQKRLNDAARTWIEKYETGGKR